MEHCSALFFGVSHRLRPVPLAPRTRGPFFLTKEPFSVQPLSPRSFINFGIKCQKPTKANEILDRYQFIFDIIHRFDRYAIGPHQLPVPFRQPSKNPKPFFTVSVQRLQDSAIKEEARRQKHLWQ